MNVTGGKYYDYMYVLKGFCMQFSSDMTDSIMLNRCYW